MNPLLVNSIVKKMKPSQASNQTTEGLPSWAKGIIAVTVLAGAAFVAYKVYKLLNTAVTNITEGKDEKETIRLVEKEIKEKIKAGDSPSFSLSSYKSTANSIAEKMQGCHDEKNEIEVIKLVIKQVKKPLDWLLLSQAFDKRKIDNCGIWPLDGGDTFYELGNLLKTELKTKTQPTTANIQVDNFLYDTKVSGVKKTYDILDIWLKKIKIKI